ncbi:MAG TPA: hypothetical protein VJ600_08485 [Holophagaceae bacterium]|nr:hypothetical protein [Holophagaceae bacterium]
MNERPDLPFPDSGDAANPYAPPQAPLEGDPWMAQEGPLRPVPFEDLAAYPGFWPRVSAMFGLVFKRPFELFERVPVTEGLSAPWRFNLLLTLPYLLFMGAIMIFIAIVSGMSADPKMPRGFITGILGGEFLLIALFMNLGMFISGAFLHASLWIWGGTRQGRGLVQTIRSIGYGTAFLNLAVIVPCLGALVALAGWVMIAIGLARVHRTDTWRAVCAVLVTPIVVCCGLYVIFFAVAIGMGGLH